ncbi:hypothetical protein EV363DRAFT_1568853 [Boletus edulis]|nr:hypothetical protein EV363DRAFT_1568853 [Boletus edulis]
MSGSSNDSNDSISSSERQRPTKDKNEPRKTGKANKKSRSKTISRGVADWKPLEWEQCLHAAQWIPQAYDMYCTLDEVLRTCRIIEQHEALDSDDKDDEESKAIKAAYDKLKSNLNWFVCGPVARQEAIGLYAAPLPDKKVVDPPVQPRGPKDKLRFNHPELARLLCPVRHLLEMLEDPVGTKKKIESGAIKVTAQKHPAFLYEGNIPGEDFDPNNVAHGFLWGFLLEHILKHIFTSPSSALSTSKSHSMRASNGKIHKMMEVNASHIAYAAVHARFSICSQDKFIDVDGHFKFPDFYYRTVDFIENGVDTTWAKELCAHYNNISIQAFV